MEILIKSELIETIIKESIPKILQEKFTSSYGNPLKDAIDAEIKSQDGVIREFVRGIFAEILTNDDLKKKVANEVIALIVQKGLKN